MTTPRRALPPVLSDVRVLELGAGLPVELVGQLLRAFGASVTKVERPGAARLGSAGAYAALNRGKEVRPLDLKSPGDRAHFEDLLPTHGVVVQNLSAGAARRLGIDFATLAGRRDDLVYCEIAGYSDTDRRHGRTGHDPTYLAAAGLFDAGVRSGWPGFPFALADHLGAVYGALAVVAALRRPIVRPLRFQVSLFDAAAGAAQQRLAEVEEAEGAFRLDDLRGGLGLFRTADGVAVAIAAAEPHFFAHLADVLRLDDLLAADLLTSAGRARHGAVVNAAVAARVGERSWADLGPALEAGRVPHERAVDLASALAEDLEANPEAFGRTADGALFRHPPLLAGIGAG